MVAKGTCGTEYSIECLIDYDNDFYFINLNSLTFIKNQPVYGLGSYEEKALKDALKKVEYEHIKEEIEKQFGV